MMFNLFCLTWSVTTGYILFKLQLICNLSNIYVKLVRVDGLELSAV